MLGGWISKVWDVDVEKAFTKQPFEYENIFSVRIYGKQFWRIWRENAQCLTNLWCEEKVRD